MTVEIYLRATEGKTSLASMDDEEWFPVKLKGVDKSPTNNESEKFNVASVARNMPRTSSENDWRSR